MPANGRWDLIRRLKVKGEGKVHPKVSHEGPEGKKIYSCTLSLTSVLDGVGGLALAQMVEVLLCKTEGRGFDDVIGIFN